MMIVALAEAVVIVVLVFALVARERENDELVQQIIREDNAERQLLLNRIQRPDLVTTAPRVRRERPDPPTDLANLAKVGTIVRDAPSQGADLMEK